MSDTTITNKKRVAATILFGFPLIAIGAIMFAEIPWQEDIRQYYGVRGMADKAYIWWQETFGPQIGGSLLIALGLALAILLWRFMTALMRQRS